MLAQHLQRLPFGYLEHPNRFEAAAPRNYAVVESHIRRAAAMLPYFEACGCFSCDIETVRVAVRGQKYVIGGCCVDRLGKRWI